MATYDLKGFQESAIYQLNQAQGSLRLEGDWLPFRSRVREICDHFMTLSAASLLSDMKINLFFLNITRAAENWRRYLLASRDHFQKTSPLVYNSPLYGAILSGDRLLMQGLADVMPVSFQQGEEYPDQFHATWLYLLLALNDYELNADIEKHLSAFEDAGGDPTQLDAFKALLGLDDLEEADYWMCFDIRYYAHEETLEQQIMSVATSISKFIAHRYIWFEGLVWLKAAQKKGFTLPSSGIKFCPDEALGEMPESYNNDWLLVPVP